MTDYPTPALQLQAEELVEAALTELAAQTGVQPEKDSPLNGLVRAVSLGQAATNQNAVDFANLLAEAVFTMFGRPQREGTPATVLGTITASTAAPVGGYTITAGDTYLLETAGGDQALVEVVETVTIAEGDTTTDPGEVEFVFQQPGVAYNDLTGSLTLVEPRLAWFLSGATAAPSSGGEDAEGKVDYRDAGTRYLRQITPKPVTEDDWESASLDADDSIARVLVIPRWNADTSSAAALCFTEALAKADGTAVGVDAKNKVLAIPRLSDVELFLVDPNLFEFDVTATVVRRAEYTSLQAEAAAEAAIRAWGDPAVWGASDIGEQSTWSPEPVIRVKEAEAVLVRPQEVHYVDPATAVTLQVVGVDGTPHTTDRTLTGLAPLAKARNVTITVLDPS